MPDYVDQSWVASPAAMRAALLPLGWWPTPDEGLALGWLPDGAAEPAPRPATIAGFVVRASVDVAGQPAWVALIRATAVLTRPAGVQEAPAWVADALVGRIAALSPIPTLSRRQLLLGMAGAGLITMPEAVAAAQTGAVPASIEAVFGALPEPSQSAARVTFAAMSEAIRTDPLVSLLAASHGISAAALDQMWLEWAAI